MDEARLTSPNHRTPRPPTGCFHQSMNPFQPSQCPLCRARFAHLPRVCPKLHALLGAAFPSEYAQRASETAESEAERGAESEAVPVEPRLAQSAAAAVEARRRAGAPAAAAGAVAEAAAAEAPAAEALAGNEAVGDVFACDACHELLLEPCVLTCGHAVCRGCVARVRPQQARGCCPACGQAQLSQLPGVCLQFDKLLQAWLPEATAARERREAALSAASEPAKPEDGEAATAWAPPQGQEGGQGPAPAGAGAQQLPPTAAALLASNRPLQEIWPDLERELLAVADERYCWHGVGWVNQLGGAMRASPSLPTGPSPMKPFPRTLSTKQRPQLRPLRAVPHRGPPLPLQVRGLGVGFALGGRVPPLMRGLGRCLGGFAVWLRGNGMGGGTKLPVPACEQGRHASSFRAK